MKILFVASMLALALAGCATVSEVDRSTVAEPAAVKETASGRPPVQPLVERWGVEVVGLRETSGGYMLDFRFKVLDAAKAAPLFDRATSPYLLVPATGAKFFVPNPPKTGPLRTSDPPREGIVYWMFFANPGRDLRPGAEATVVIGEFNAENLIVE
jgi:hypothetical protein